MTTKTLCVQNYVSHRTPTGERVSEWVISEFEVDSMVDENGVEYLSVGGIRFALVYKPRINVDVDLVTNLSNPHLLPTGCKAQEIGLLLWTSCTGIHSPSRHARWIKEKA